jgi:hypothetical protein
MALSELDHDEAVGVDEAASDQEGEEAGATMIVVADKEQDVSSLLWQQFRIRGGMSASHPHEARKIMSQLIRFEMPVTRASALHQLAKVLDLSEAEVVRVCLGAFFARFARAEEQRQMLRLVKSCLASDLAERAAERSAGIKWVRKAYRLPAEQRAALLTLQRDLHLSLTVLLDLIFSFPMFLLLSGLETPRGCASTV